MAFDKMFVIGVYGIVAVCYLQRKMASNKRWLIFTALMVLLEYGVIPQTRMGYYCHDLSISHPFHGDTITMYTLLIGCLLGPLVILILVELCHSKSKRRAHLLQIWNWYKELLIGVTMVLSITEVGKVVVGEHRPHFISTCAPDTENTCEKGSYVSDFKCTSTQFSHYMMVDSSRSFPSGHSSASVFVAVFCACFVHYRFSTTKGGRLLKPLLITACLCWGVVCSLTRISDRRHHWWDVLIGAVLGAFCAVYTVVALCSRFQPIIKSARSSASTTTLLDVKNQAATSVII